MTVSSTFKYKVLSIIQLLIMLQCTNYMKMMVIGNQQIKYNRNLPKGFLTNMAPDLLCSK